MPRNLILALLIGALVGILSLSISAKAQSATSIIQQSSRAESSPCGYRSVADWWKNILTCRAFDAQGRVYYYRVRAR